MQRSDIEAPVGNYGQDWKSGVLSEHIRPGHAVRCLAGGTSVVIQPDGKAERIVCSELIRVETEDGPVSGRCGRPVTPAEHHLMCCRHGGN